VGSNGTCRNEARLTENGGSTPVRGCNKMIFRYMDTMIALRQAVIFNLDVE